jgi:hypothetical protein
LKTLNIGETPKNKGFSATPPRVGTARGKCQSTGRVERVLAVLVIAPVRTLI